MEVEDIKPENISIPKPKPRRSARLADKINANTACLYNLGAGGPEEQKESAYDFEATVNPNTSLSEVYAMMLHGDQRDATKAFTPDNRGQALSSSDAKEWLKAMNLENKSLEDNEVFEKIKVKDLPKDVELISGRWVFKVKSNGEGKIQRFKARVVARGDQAKLGVHYFRRYSPVACASTIRFLLAIAVSLGLYLRAGDVKTAFLYARMPKDVNVYVRPPPGTDCGDDEVWRLKGALYGMPNAPCLWHDTFSTELKISDLNSQSMIHVCSTKLTKVNILFSPWLSTISSLPPIPKTTPRKFLHS